MEQSWSMSCEDFGRIKSGKIAIAPLVLIMGDNNSGKSYVMSLLWGLMTEGRTLFPTKVPVGKSYNQIDELIQEIAGHEHTLSDEEMQLFIDWYNDLLRQKRHELVHRVFRKEVGIKSLKIEDYSRKHPLQLKFEKKDSLEGTRYSKTSRYIRFPYTEESRESKKERYRMAQYITWTLLMEGLTSSLSSTAGFRRAVGEALYLPASRTGFMLTYRALMQELMEMKIGDELRNSSEFTLPVYRFLQGLIDVDGKADKRSLNIAAYLERAILSGEMKMEKDIIPSFYYTPKGEEDGIPMFLSSSLVTELAPLILFLKTKQTYRTLFFEEAEAHLHPRVQKVLATAIAKIVNGGMPVFMTTHSDLILQQINNLMKLSVHPEREQLMSEYQYEVEDLLKSSEVKAYQFTAERGMTTIQEIESTPYGFPAETFNKIIIELQEETLAFQEEEDG